MSVHFVTFRVNCVLGNHPRNYPLLNHLSIYFDRGMKHSRAVQQVFREYFVMSRIIILKWQVLQL